MILLSEFTRIKTEITHLAYQSAIWTFDLITDQDILSDLTLASYQPINSQLPISNKRMFYVDQTSKSLDKFILELNNLIFNKIKNLVYSLEMQEIFQTASANTFFSRWPIQNNDFDKKIFSKTLIIKDLPEFNMGKHLDNQRVVGNAIINLTENDCKTDFYDYKDHEKIIFSHPGTKNRGVFFLNTPASLHGIKNFDKTRYIANPSFMINYW